MMSHRLRVVAGAVLALFLLPGAVPAADGPERLAARIDHHLDQVFAAQGIRPAPLIDDAAFARRVYLDLAGRIPRVAELRDFLDEKSPAKRRALVDRLLDGPHFTNHFTNVWRSQWFPEVNTEQARVLTSGFEAWLRTQVSKNVPYDQMVREVLTASVTQPARQRGGSPTPLPFYQANELKPENLAASTSRAFLGVKLECAQCHDHPFAKWTRTQFWEYAAFFSGIRPAAQPGGQGAAATEVSDSREIDIPLTTEKASARFLDGKSPAWKPDAGTRQTLADWATSGDNPFFARNAANRLWAYFFGNGLIDPVDEPGDDNPPSHPALLDELARELVQQKFDLKYLMRAVTLSRAYQRASTLTDPSQEDPKSFARMPLKGMTPEQLFESLKTATGFREAAAPRPAAPGGPPPSTPRAEFLARFSGQEKRTEQQTSILQALALMNGKFLADLTSSDLARSETLAAVIEAPFFDAAGRVEALFLATLSRKPRSAELARFVAYVEEGGARKDAPAALADVFWALLNSTEFVLNH